MAQQDARDESRNELELYNILHPGNCITKLRGFDSV